MEEDKGMKRNGNGNGGVNRSDRITWKAKGEGEVNVASARCYHCQRVVVMCVLGDLD